MQYLNFSRTFLLACLLAPACGDNGGDSSTDGTTTAATPGTSTDPTPGTSTDPTSGTSTDPTPGTTEPTTTTPTTEPTTADPTGDPTGADGTFCQEQCAADDDCKSMGMDIGLKCTDGRCAGGGCADDNACIQQFSGWIMDCAAQADCPGQACIDIGGGVGKCAIIPNEMAMLTCATFMLKDAMYPPIEGGADILVCANTDYQCKDGACINPCESDMECTLVPGLSQCDMGTGTCRCADDAGCMGANPMTPKCTEAGFCGCATDANCVDPNAPTCTPDGFCGCSTDDNCTAAMTGDKCFNGSCGCSDATACPATTIFDNTMFVCESFE
jgi:hypothetical protein